MKKFFILSTFLVFLYGCSVDDGDANITYDFEVLPIESVVEIPDEFELGKTYPITVNYFRPSTCHSFNEFYYMRENNERTVAVIAVDFNRDDCEDLTNQLVEATFNFNVTSNGSYIFKFWQGEDEDENDKYLTIEVPVVE